MGRQFEAGPVVEVSPSRRVHAERQVEALDGSGEPQRGQRAARSPSVMASLSHLKEPDLVFPK